MVQGIASLCSSRHTRHQQDGGLHSRRRLWLTVGCWKSGWKRLTTW